MLKSTLPNYPAGTEYILDQLAGTVWVSDYLSGGESPQSCFTLPLLGNKSSG